MDTPKKPHGPAPHGETETKPPLPPNPYRRFYTKQRSFEELVRTARERKKQNTTGEPQPE